MAALHRDRADSDPPIRWASRARPFDGSSDDLPAIVCPWGIETGNVISGPRCPVFAKPGSMDAASCIARRTRCATLRAATCCRTGEPPSTRQMTGCSTPAVGGATTSRRAASALFDDGALGPTWDGTFPNRSPRKRTLCRTPRTVALAFIHPGHQDLVGGLDVGSAIEATLSRRRRRARRCCPSSRRRVSSAGSGPARLRRPQALGAAHR